MPAHFTVELNPVDPWSVSFIDLYILDVLRLQSPDAPGPHRPAFFCRDNKLFAAGFLEPPSSSKTQLPPTHDFGLPFGPYSIYSPTRGRSANDVEIPLTGLPRGGMYSVNATFGDLISADGARLLVDGGSSTTWLYSENLQEMGEGDNETGNEQPATVSRDGALVRRGHRLYRPENGARALGRTFDVAYKDGSRIAGDGYEDKVVLLNGGNNPATPPVTLMFGVATTANRMMLRQSTLDGVLGLGYARPNDTGSFNVPSFLECIAEQYAVEGPYFSLKLRDGNGTITFGPPPDPLTFEWETVVTSNLDWDLYSSTMEIRHQGQDWTRLDLGYNNVARLDSGCALCYLHPSQLEKVYGPLGGMKIDGIWYIPKTAPHCYIKVQLGKTWIQLPRRFLHSEEYDQGYDCGTLQIRTGDVDVYGAYFLRCIDTYFLANAEEPKIGFVPPS